jgi:hypothetical protein
MADRGTEKRARFALADLVAGRYQDVAAFLAKLGDVPVPELETPKQRQSKTTKDLRTRIADLERQLAIRPLHVASNETYSTARARQQEELRQQRAQEPVTPLPKPSRRVVNREIVAEFRANNPRCCVTTCGNHDADPHHIWPRGRGGPDDSFANLMPLCRWHHEEIERIDNEAFRTKYVNRLPETVLEKMKLAMRMEADAKLGQRDAVDLDDDLHALEDA